MTKFVVDNGKNLIQAYDAAETDALLNQKANAADVYNKTEVDAKDYDLEQRIGAVDNKFADYYPQFAIDLMLEGKANTSGEYDDITAGHAKQLTSRVGETDKTPYNFRTSGGSLDIGDLETDKIIGGSVAWNQLQTSKTGDSKTAQYLPMFGANWDYTVTLGHVYFVSFLQPAGCSVYRQNCKNFPCGYREYNAPTTATTISFITKSTENGVTAGVGDRLISKNETTETAYALDNLQFIDLTQMFGATIADYIYNLEQSTAGAGVAWFKKLFPKTFYSFNAGQIMSVKTSKHVTVDFNAWDEETELGNIDNGTGATVADNTRLRTKNYIPVVPNVTYYFSTQTSGQNYYINPYYYDKSFNYIGRLVNGAYSPKSTNATNYQNPFVIPADAYYMKFVISSQYGTEYKNDICINISWDGERNGEYEPYVANEYYLQNDLELRGIFKLDANNKLYADGDEYPDSGEVTRKYGVFDCDTQTMENGTVGVAHVWFAQLTNAKAPEDSSIFNGMSAKYEPIRFNAISTAAGLVAIRSNGILYINNGSTTTPPSGKIIYELATPTIETVNGYTNPQKVDDFGTEQYVDGREVEIPVGHETFYVANLKAKLEMSPDSPDANGLYLMQHNNGENVYTPYVSPIPALPSTDGTFVLKCTVSGTTKTLTWVEET